MKRTLWSLCILLCATSAQAQLYKWVGPDGKITYTDSPPPSSAKHVEAKAVTGGGVNTSGFPYELSEAAKNHPVTLYTTANCAPCDEGRQLLTGRGIPFSEKTVNSGEDIAQYKKINSEGHMPFLRVGRKQERGFESAAWNMALTAAGYPETSQLPKTYRNPPAAAVAPAPKPVASTQERQTATVDEAPSATDLPPPTGNAPPGFRF
jgi:glutaredoxin